MKGLGEEGEEAQLGPDSGKCPWDLRVAGPAALPQQQGPLADGKEGADPCRPGFSLQTSPQWRNRSIHLCEEHKALSLLR